MGYTLHNTRDNGRQAPPEGARERAEHMTAEKSESILFPEAGRQGGIPFAAVAGPIDIHPPPKLCSSGDFLEVTAGRSMDEWTSPFRGAG
jgi:hypothetical protein